MFLAILYAIRYKIFSPILLKFPLKYSVSILQALGRYLPGYGLKQFGQCVDNILAKLAFEGWNKGKMTCQIHILKGIVPVIIPK